MEAKRTTLTHTLRDGQLEHVVVVKGEPVQTHSSRAAAMCALMLALALTGCASTRDWVVRHPKTSVFIAASIALSVPALTSHGHNRSSYSGPEPQMSIPLVPDCAKFAELCK